MSFFVGYPVENMRNKDDTSFRRYWNDGSGEGAVRKLRTLINNNDLGNSGQLKSNNR